MSTHGELCSINIVPVSRQNYGYHTNTTLLSNLQFCVEKRGRYNFFISGEWCPLQAPKMAWKKTPLSTRETTLPHTPHYTRETTLSHYTCNETTLSHPTRETTLSHHHTTEVLRLLCHTPQGRPLSLSTRETTLSLTRT